MKKILLMSVLVVYSFTVCGIEKATGSKVNNDLSSIHETVIAIEVVTSFYAMVNREGIVFIKVLKQID